MQAAAEKQDMNPTNDPKVKEGIERQRQVYKDRQAAAIDAEKSKNYRIDKSGAGGSGIPTSGGYPPPNPDPNTNKNTP